MISVREMSGKCQGILTKPVAMNPVAMSSLIGRMHARNDP